MCNKVFHKSFVVFCANFALHHLGSNAYSDVGNLTAHALQHLPAFHGDFFFRLLLGKLFLQFLRLILIHQAVKVSLIHLIQEVDIDSTRSYHIDQKEILEDVLPGKNSTFALNYDSPYLFYPFTEPHGKSVAGLLTLSDFEINRVFRRSLPIQEDLAKLVDLDRCYTVNRINTSDGRALVLYNFHLSAYTTEPTIANRQLEMLYEDMAAEYAAGNYVISGGDFNKDLLGDSSKIFGVSGEDFSWAQPLPVDAIPDGFSLAAPFDAANPVPSCRNADRPWDPETNFQLTIDGFLVSDNVKVIASDVVDFQFAYSDHNPVQMSFALKK